MACKCSAETYEDHLDRVEAGYASHVYTGPYWAPDSRA